MPGTSISGWQRWIDTARGAPDDIIEPSLAPLVSERQYRVMPRSIAALLLRIDASL
jgi:hypothetical protein